jgi:hypothetical protein
MRRWPLARRQAARYRGALVGQRVVSAAAGGGIIPRRLSGFLSSDGCHMAVGDIAVGSWFNS